MEPYSIYLHIPFCLTRCSYCDFNTTVNRTAQIPEYTQALCREIENTLNGQETLPEVHSIYFGGGTPTLVPMDQLSKILETLGRYSLIQGGAEMTLEANPCSLSGNYLESLVQVGLNRLSIGMQSTDPILLNLLGRRHTFGDVLESVTSARAAGFTNISIDLIFGIPTQSIEQWQDTLEKALTLGIDHISMYSLTLEENTPLTRRVSRGLLPPVDDDLAADMYELAGEILLASGFQSYEVSNWARREKDGTIKSSRHNLQYWRNLPYLGLGAGAHGYARGVRTVNIRDINTYIQRTNEDKNNVFPAGPATDEIITIDPLEEMRETMMVGLRLTEEGVGNDRFEKRFGKSLLDVFPNEIIDLTKNGLLEWAGENGNNLRLTRRGRILGNRVFIRFVGG